MVVFFSAPITFQVAALVGAVGANPMIITVRTPKSRVISNTRLHIAILSPPIRVERLDCGQPRPEGLVNSPIAVTAWRDQPAYPNLRAPANGVASRLPGLELSCMHG